MARRPKKSEEAIANAVEEENASEAIEETAGVGAEAESINDVKVDMTHAQCGQAFAAARLDAGMTTKEVAKQLRLSNTQIEALEQDDFASLPEATIVKGFIRNYAKLLKIPAEPLINAYVEMVPAKDDYTFALNPGINMKITDSGKSHKLRYVMVAIGLLLAAAVWFFYQNYVQKPNPVSPMQEMEAVLPELSLPMAERIENVPVTQLEMPEPNEVQEATEQDKTEQGETEKSKPVETAASEKVVEPVTDTVETQGSTPSEDVVAADAVIEDEVPPVTGKTRLEFTAMQETWLSVVNTSGREVYNKTLYAGGRDTVDIRNPSEIVVGNAHGAKLSIDGKPINLAPYTRVNVARVRMNRLR